MGGRDSLSPEGRLAANYIAGFFHRAGLKPVGDRGTYFQNFQMTAARIDRERTFLRASFGKDGGITRDFAMGPDFSLGRQGNVDAAVRAPLVFAGYGIDAPEYGYNDFKGIDVRGKKDQLLQLDLVLDAVQRALSRRTAPSAVASPMRVFRSPL